MPNKSPEKVTGRTRILIVEDERLIAKDIERSLSRFGYKVVGSTDSGELALVLTGELRPDLVIMDVVLSGAVSGVQAAQSIWERWRVPAVYVTAYSDAGTLDKLKQSEVYGYLVKPFEPRALRAVVQLALARRDKEQCAETADRRFFEPLRQILQDIQVQTWHWPVAPADGPWWGGNFDAAEPEAVRSFLNAIYRDDRARVEDALLRVLEEPGSTFSVHHRFAAPDPACVWLTRGVCTWEANRITAFTGASIKIRSDENGVARPLLRNADQVEQLISTSSHDLQEPLQTVRSFTELLTKRLPISDNADEIHHLLQHIRSGANRMQALLRDLLVYSESGQPQEMQLQNVQADEVLHSAMLNLAAAIEESGAQVTQGPLPTVLADPDQLSQVFQNLIGNAIKYGQPAKPPRIHIAAEATSDAWQFLVQDNGIGVAQEDREKIFEPFERLHGRSIPGTGMGLATCRRIIELHGGRMWMTSNLDAGSLFSFTIPRKPS